MKKIIIITVVVLLLGGGAAYYFYGNKTAAKKSEVKIVSPVIGKIEILISTTGNVQPKNRVEMKPTVAGRVDSILVEEGDKVKKGQILAWLSSTERTVVLDAARSQGPEVIKHWEDVYKQTPIIAQIDGEVIVRNVEPGQSVTQATAVLVLSDKLVVNAKVDETDIGKVKVGQEARISLDAYQDVKERGTVDHISYESKLVNNVTTYDVEIIPKNIPSVFRSGMSSNVDIIQDRKKDILILPLAAVRKESSGSGRSGKSTDSRQGKGSGGSDSRESNQNKNNASIGDSYVMVKKEGVLEPVKVIVKTGLADAANIEIISGIGPDDKIIIESKKFSLSTGAPGSSPFMPARPVAGAGGGGRGR